MVAVSPSAAPPLLLPMGKVPPGSYSIAVDPLLWLVRSVRHFVASLVTWCARLVSYVKANPVKPSVRLWPVSRRHRGRGNRICGPW